MREQERVLLSVNGLMFQSPLSTTSNQFPVWFETNHLLGWIEHGNLQTTFSIRCVHGNQRGVTVKITHETLCHRYYELSHSSTSSKQDMFTRQIALFFGKICSFSGWNSQKFHFPIYGMCVSLFHSLPNQI